MRAKDWSATHLGPPERWPQSLRTGVRIILASRYPMFVWWGKDRINLYNDPYTPFLGTKHPGALGRPAQEVWSEIWSEVGPRSDAALLRGESTYDEALLLMMAAAGRLASTVAHEINNPLESVVNLLYLARKAESPEQQDQYLEYAEREINRVSHIARQTLGFYREAAQFTRIPISSLLQTLLQVYQGKLRSKKIDVNLDVDPNLEITTRGGELNQVLSNLITNAIDACTAGGCLRIAAKSTSETDNAGVTITVADDGQGIDPENLSRVFEPFFTTKKDVGTGLGLWVVKQIVEANHGTVNIDSSTDPERRGTTVTLRLPALEDEMKARAVDRSSSAA